MNDTLSIGDEIRLQDGSIATVNACDKWRGIYLAGGLTLFRHQFTPTKWLPAAVTSTGIGVCAQGANGQ